jgi:hypothetical protein
MITPVLSPERYAIERAICAKAQAYAESVMCEGGTIRARVAGREYTGRGFGECMAVMFRETAASKRKRGASKE